MITSILEYLESSASRYPDKTELYCDKNENYEISNGVQERFSFYHNTIL